MACRDKGKHKPRHRTHKVKQDSLPKPGLPPLVVAAPKAAAPVAAAKAPVSAE